MGNWILKRDLKGPQGEQGEQGEQGNPGLENVPTDPGIAALISTAGTSETKTALYANFARNVKAFGAKGDGVTNDTAAVQAAINTGDPVYLPAGNYMCGALTKTNNAALFGDGFGRTTITARAGTGTLLTARQQAGMRLEGFALNGNGIAATVLDTEWTIVAGLPAPSQNNQYSRLRISGWTSIGWRAKSNNDSDFDTCLIDNGAAGTVGLQVNASGGLIRLNDMTCYAPTEMTAQAMSIIGGVFQGVRIMGGDYNMINASSGYWYADPTYHTNLWVAPAAAARAGAFSGVHVENEYADGTVFGGSGALGGSDLIGSHLFATGPGVGHVKLLATTLASGGPRGRFALHGGSTDGIELNSTTAFVVAPHNVVVSGVFAAAEVEVASTDGGGRTFMRSGMVGHEEGLGVMPTVVTRVVTVPANTDVTVTGIPRTALLNVRATDLNAPTYQCGISRRGANAGLVSMFVSDSVAGAAFTITVPASAAQNGFLTDIVVRHNYTTSLVVMIGAFGF